MKCSNKKEERLLLVGLFCTTLNRYLCSGVFLNTLKKYVLEKPYPERRSGRETVILAGEGMSDLSKQMQFMF